MPLFRQNDEPCKVGIAFFGGAGTNTARRIVEMLKPEEYPNFRLFVANTDARAQDKHFGEGDELRMRWEEANALVVHTLGGDEVTKGRGAGAKPENGRKAAETEYSSGEIRNFFKDLDTIILLAGLGGGTGTGATPVAAQIAKETGKPVLAIVIMPRPMEGRTKRATVAKNEIQALVPTMVVQNAYLDTVLREMDEEKRKQFTFEDAFDLVNRSSLVPMLLILRSIIQHTGGIMNRDIADWETVLELGHYPAFGMMDVSDKRDAAAEEIANELMAARFQDPDVIKCGLAALFWFHGPWPMEKAETVQRLVKQCMTGGDASKERDIEIMSGIDHRVEDGKMWVGMVVVAHDLLSANEQAAAKSTIVVPRTASDSLPLAARSEQPGNGENKSDRPRIHLEMVEFKSAGKLVEHGFPKDFADRLRAALANPNITLAEFSFFVEEVRHLKRGVKLDFPEHLQPKPEPVPPRGFMSAVFGGPQTRPN